jgi:DNA replication protein DnaC
MTQSIDAARLTLMLNDLRLPAIKQDWPDFAERANKESWPAARFLATLAEHEIAERDRRRLARHLAEAQLLPGKTLDSFDFDVVPMISKAHVMAICAGDSWIDKGANLILIGGPGGGKTHLASAIGLALVEKGWRVLFARTSDLVQRLQVARRELALEAAINRLDRFDLLILDDLAYVSKDQAETSMLFELISARYECRSIAITANQPIRGMGEGLSRPRNDARCRRPSRPSRHNLRNQRRQLSTPRSARSQAQSRRTAPGLRDNQRSPRRVAPRQSNRKLALATNNQTKHHVAVAVTVSHPD